MKTGKQSVDERKLMDRLPPLEAWGQYEGFWSTTFEFQPEFFETDFLPSLLDLGAWSDRNWSSRIVLEKELATMKSATVMVEAQRYSGRPRSLRVEICPSRGEAGSRLHAKVSIFLHEKAVRLTVGSANLTEPGYRHNIEVVVSLVASESEPEQAPIVRAALLGAEAHLASWWSKMAGEITSNALGLLDRLRPPRVAPSEWFAWSGPGDPLWRQFLDRWPAGERATEVTVVSPFWSEEDGTGPLASFIRELAGMGSLVEKASMRLLTPCAEIGLQEYQPVLPQTVAGFNFSTLGIACFAEAVDPQITKEEILKDDFLGTRPLHAKIVLLEGPEVALAYVGSANFTAKGWGFLPGARRANVEAGLILLRRGSARSELQQLIPETVGRPVTLDGTEAQRVSQPTPMEAASPWPDFLREVRLVESQTDKSKLELLALIKSEAVEGPWSIELASKLAGVEPRLVTSEGLGSKQNVYRCPLAESQLNLLLLDQEVRVGWWACTDGISFPINVSEGARDKLPISPDALKPDEGLLLAYYQGRIPYEELFPPLESSETTNQATILDELEVSGVDTSNIQSYRVREFVEALEGIRNDLLQASVSERSMRLALLGPVSPLALAKTISDTVGEGKLKRSPVAAGFQLVELEALLRSVKTWESAGAWENHRAKAQTEIAGILEDLRKKYPRELGGRSAFRKYEGELRGAQHRDGNAE